MIKGLLGYLKSLKLFLTLFGIGCFMVLGVNSVNANYQFFQIGLDSFQSDWDSNYSVGVLKRGRFLSNYLGTSKNILALANQKLYFWNNGQLYSYNNVNVNRLEYVQGYMQYVFSCDEITASSTGTLNNCGSPYLVGAYDEVVSNFIDGLVIGDWVYVEENSGNQGCGSYCTYNWFNTKVCFSSSKYHHTMCFYGETNTYPSYVHINYPFGASLGFDNNITFGNINRDMLSEPPGFVNNIDGGSNSSVPTELTGNLTYNSCTVGYVVNAVRKTYGSSVDNFCYAGTFNTGVVSSDLTIGDVYKDRYGFTFKELYNMSPEYFGSFNDWWDGNTYKMQQYKLGNYGNFNPFTQYTISEYTYFENLYNKVLGYDTDYFFLGDTSYFVVNYCKLLLNTGSYNNEYKGTYFGELCNNLSAGNNDGNVVIDNSGGGTLDGDSEMTPPGYTPPSSNNSSSGVAVSVSWDGTLSGNTNQNFDGKTFINDFYQKLQSRFQKPLGLNIGFLPTYIMVFLCAIILFRFISH